MTLKVWVCNVTGSERYFVATATKTEAVKLMETTMHQFNKYGCETHNDPVLSVVLKKPGILFVQSTTEFNADGLKER